MTRRARTDADKALRRVAIVDAARSVFDSVGVDAFTMDTVACSLGLAKGTLYRYVPTREALLLALATEEYRGWFADVDAALGCGTAAVAGVAGATATSGDTDLAAMLVEALLARPRMLRLLPMLSSVLERNVPFEVAHEFKAFVVGHTSSTSVLLAQRIGCSPGSATRLLVHLQALTVGLSHHANPAPVMVEVMAADPTLASVAIDLRAELLHGARALLRAVGG